MLKGFNENGELQNVLLDENGALMVKLVGGGGGETNTEWLVLNNGDILNIALANCDEYIPENVGLGFSVCCARSMADFNNTIVVFQLRNISYEIPEGEWGAQISYKVKFYDENGGIIFASENLFGYVTQGTSWASPTIPSIQAARAHSFSIEVVTNNENV